MADAPDEFGLLLTRARQGDATSLMLLAQQYEPEVRIVARLCLGSALRPYLDSVDLVQSVHRSLLLGLRQGKFDITSPEKLIALALTLVHRKVARHWRRLQRQHRLSGGAASDGNLVQLLTSLQSTETDPARAAQFRDTVAHVCAQLDAADRPLLEMHLQGFRTVEIARELGLDADVLRVRLSRLRRRLREQGMLADGL